MLALKSTLLSQAGAKRVDFGNMLAHGLFFARIGPDVVFGSAPIQAAFTERGIDRTGANLRTLVGGGNHRQTLRAPVTSSAWTVFMVAASPSTSGYNTAWGITEPGDSNRIHLHFRIFDSERFGADCRPYKSDYNSAGYTYPTDLTNVAAGVVINGPANSIALYANGVQTDTTTLDDTSAVTISEVEFFAKNNGSDTAADNSTLSLCLAWSRALTAAEMLSLSANPWQVFA